MVNEKSGSIGTLQGLKLGSKEEKKKGVIEEKKDSGLEVKKIKRSYYLTEDAIKKLGQMKLDDFPIGTSLEFIVEKAILELYQKIHK